MDKKPIPVSKSVVIGFIVLSQLLFQFLIQIYVIRSVGIGAETDAYFASLAIPMMVFVVTSTALQSVWLPRFSKTENDSNSLHKELSIAQAQAVIVTSVAIFTFAFTIPIWVPLLYSSFSEHQIVLTKKFTLVLLVGILFNTLSALLTKALHVKNKFVLVEIIILIVTIFSLFMIILTLPHYGILSVAYVMVGRSCLIYVIQFLLTGRPVFRFKESSNDYETWKLMVPLLWGGSLFKLSPAVDKIIASYAFTGGVTVLFLAQKLMSVIASVLERAISVPTFPNLNRIAVSSQYSQLKKLYRKCIFKIAGITFFLGIVLYVGKSVFLDIVIISLGISEDASYDLWLMCILLLGFLFVAASGSIASNVFFALGDTNTPVNVGVVGFILGLMLKVVFFLKFGIHGLVIAISLTYLITMIMNCFFLERKITFVSSVTD